MLTNTGFSALALRASALALLIKHITAVRFCGSENRIMKRKNYTAFFAGALFAAPLFAVATFAFGQVHADASAGAASASAASVTAVPVTMTDRQRDALIRSLMARVQKLERRVVRLENLLKARTGATPLPRPLPFKEPEDMQKFKKRLHDQGSGNIRVCHAGDGADMTLRVNIAAMKAHLGHGDTLGVCGSGQFNEVLKKLLERKMTKMQEAYLDHLDDEEDAGDDDDEDDDDDNGERDDRDEEDGDVDDSAGTAGSNSS